MKFDVGLTCLVFSVEGTLNVVFFTWNTLTIPSGAKAAQRR